MEHKVRFISLGSSGVGIAIYGVGVHLGDGLVVH